MDIPALSIAMSSANTAASVNIAVLKMAKETMEVNGQQLVEMIESTSVDIKV